MSSGSDLRQGYTLVVCEKPDAARRISEALAEKGVEIMKVGGTQVFRFVKSGEVYVVGAATGHLYGVGDPFDERGIYPVFDVEWFPEEKSSVKSRIEAFRKLGVGAAKIINACDYDAEGETIGFNVLRYACDGKEREAQRAKFSTLTKEELVRAFEGTEPRPGIGLALAGRARHLLDFIWGVNLSRALAESARNASGRYRKLSVGRVQGPTLSYVVEREVEIRSFVPTPFWTVSCLFESKDFQFEGSCSIERIPRRAEAQRIREECEGKSGFVSKVSRSIIELPPPPPFNTGDMQKEGYRVLGYAPSRTLQIAERLYLDALISYPRTNSQKLPPSIGYAKILAGIGRMSEYSREVGELVKGVLRPREGQKDDPAHPAVYPTGERPRRAPMSWERRLLDLVIRRFMAAFAPPALQEWETVSIRVGEFEFRATGRKTLKEGWLSHYSRYLKGNEKPLPPLVEGDEVRIVRVDSAERFVDQPSRYNQSSLLEKMERENLGTKATRAEIISTLIGRGYVTNGQTMTATDVGFAVIETMNAYNPAILSAELTRELEERLGEVEKGAENEAKSLVGRAIRTLSESLAMISSNEESIGRELNDAANSAVSVQYTLGPCPMCKTGKLKVVRSRRTRKRFVGCTNYPEACTASAPLPQRGAIRTTGRACEGCGWPIVYVKLGRFPWKLCVNPRCPRKAKKNEMQALQKRG